MGKGPSVLMIAAENDGLQAVDGRGGKVGGIGDVVRDVPPALARLGCDVTVATPSYGCLHRAEGAKTLGEVAIPSAGAARVCEMPGKTPRRGVRHLVFDHPGFVTRGEHGEYQIYWQDPPWRPFATDATRFAFFCRTVAEALRQDVIDRPECIHLHDWHAAFFLLLREFDESFSFLKEIRCVYTIHNLALQGARPLDLDESSLASWYPSLSYDLEKVNDRRWPDCVNPMAVGIRLADMIHTVSPSYAEEILEPSNRKEGYYGGEGLEEDLRQAAAEKRLVGILNGTDYGNSGPGEKPPTRRKLAGFLMNHVLSWIGREPQVSARNFLAYARLQDLRSSSGLPKILLTSVTRVTEQKIELMRSPTEEGGSRSALEQILDLLERENGRYILLGTGDSEYEEFLAGLAARYESFVFLNGFSVACADALYANGDLFLMPSSFEPCGISQMLAMKQGQPCVVHGVGGLEDTIDDSRDGFAFSGGSITEKARNFVHRCEDAFKLKRENAAVWKRMCQRASKKRFLWKDTAQRYVSDLYSADTPEPRTPG